MLRPRQKVVVMRMEKRGGIQTKSRKQCPGLIACGLEIRERVI